MSANPINDFSRLHPELRERNSVADLGLARKATLEFLKKIRSDDFEWPKITDIDLETRFYLSHALDTAGLEVYNEAVHLIQGTRMHRANYKALRDAPINCGGFKPQTAMLPDANYFEQMVALDHVISIKGENWRKPRTFCFKYDETRVIPIYVMRASTMTTVLGAARGPYKVPTYEELAESEEKATSSIFVKPLECLEAVRQPDFLGATLLKANAFAVDLISHRRRYQVETYSGKRYVGACVELKLQNNPQQAPHKERSAGSNMLLLERDSPKKNLVETLQFEDWSDESYKDDIDTSFTVNKYWKTLRNAVRSENNDELVNLTRNLFVSRMGPFTSRRVNAFYAKKLFQTPEEP